MKKIFLIITVAFLSCSRTDRNNFIDKQKEILDNIVLRDISHFDTLTKDTLVVHLRPFVFCGNDPVIYVDASPMYNDIKKIATNYGFKTVLLDTTDLFDIKYKTYSNLSHYDLNISMNSDNATITQRYYYNVKPKVIQTIRDTTIDI